MNQYIEKRGRSKTPNARTIYIRDENLLHVGSLKSISGFFNWVLSREDLREEFNTKVKK